MTEQEVRRYLRKMSEQDSQTAFRDFYDMTYDRLFRIAYYYTHHEEWSQEIVLDVFMKLWEHRKQLLEITNIKECLSQLYRKRGAPPHPINRNPT